MWRSGFSLGHAILLLVQLIFAAVGVGLLLFGQPDGVEIAAVGAGLASAPIMALAPGLLKAPTREGRKVMDEIEGLRQYLGVAEEDRLAFLHPPEKTPELFERFLPYAIALDVENVWAQRFAGVLAAAATAAAAGETMSWYHGDRDALSDPARFADRLGSDLSHTIASASTPPGSSDGGSDSSSGSSGGGSSGGGGGGGGGSGW